MSKRAKLNTIRIIGGQWRGRRLDVPDEVGLRPTIDRVRETLFNWLMHDVAGARCLDLFAGTGALGLESLSRGASFVQFVESNKSAADGLNKNLELLLKKSGNEEIHKEEHNIAHVAQRNALELLSVAPDEPFNIVFLDPPFQEKLLVQTLDLLIKNSWLAEGAMIYVEQAANANSQLNDLPDSWTLHRQGNAGQSAYCLYIS